MSYINTCIRAPERPARRKGSKIKWTYSQWARWDMSRSRPNSPIRPPTTYVWEDLRRSRSRGGYPWTHLDKDQLPDSINPEVILQGDEALYRSLSSSPVPFDYPVHQHNRSLSISSSDNNPELQALSYTSSPGQPNGSLTGSLNFEYYNIMAERNRLDEEEHEDDAAEEGIRSAHQPPEAVEQRTNQPTESQPEETDPNMTVQEQVQAFIDDLPSDEELPEYVVAYLSQRTEDDSLPEHILEYLQQRVTKLQSEEQALRELSEKQQKERAAKKEESCSDELPDFVKAYLSNRQDDDSLPEHILEYLKEEAERIQAQDEQELGIVEQTFSSLEKNKLTGYDDHYVIREQPDEVDADPFDQLFTPKTPGQKACDETEEMGEPLEAEMVQEVEEELPEEAVEPKKKKMDIKEAMRSISVPAREGFNSLKRNVQKVNTDTLNTMKKLKAPSFRRTESTSPIRQRIEKGFNRVQERMSSLTRGKKRSKSRMEQDVEDGYEPIAHPSAVPFQITTYESEDQVPRVYGRSPSTSEQPQEEEPKETEEEADVNMDNAEIQKEEPNKTKVSAMLSRGKDVWKNTTAKSKDAFKSTAAKSKDAIMITANKSKDAINRSKVALQTTAAKSKEALKNTGEKLQTTMKMSKHRKVEEPKVQLEPQDSLEGTSSTIFDIENPVDESQYDVPQTRQTTVMCDTPSFSCDVASSTPKAQQHIRTMFLENSEASEDFFHHSEETVGDQLNVAVDNPDYYNINLTEQMGPVRQENSNSTEDMLTKEHSPEVLFSPTDINASNVMENAGVTDVVYLHGPVDEIKAERDTIEKPIRKSKMPKKLLENVEANTSEGTAEIIPENVTYENRENLYENAELASNLVLDQEMPQEPATLSRPKRKPKKASVERYENREVDGRTEEDIREHEENKENTEINSENQQTFRPARSKKLRSVSKEAETKNTDELIMSADPNIDLTHYSVPKSFEVDIEAFNNQLKAAFTNPEEGYRISPNRPSRSRAKKKTISSAVHDHHYHNIPLTKRKSLSRDLPNILHAEIISQEQAPLTLPRKKNQIPNKPSRNRSKIAPSSSLAESIATMPRRKKKTCKPVLHEQNVNKTELGDDTNETIKTFPRRKPKKKDVMMHVETLSQEEVRDSSLNEEPTSDTKYVTQSEEPSLELAAADSREEECLPKAEVEPIDSLSVAPHVISIQDIHEEAPTTLPRKKKGGRVSSEQQEEQATKGEDETLTVKETEPITVETTGANLSSSYAEVTEKEVEEVKEEAAHPEQPGLEKTIEENVIAATLIAAAPVYITSGDSLGGESSDAAERIQWVEVTSPTGGTDDGYGYAVITKVGEKKKRPPRPPPPAPEESNEQYEYPVSPPPRPPLPDSYCTAPRRKKRSAEESEQSFCTIRPPRPRRKSSKEKRQSTPHPGDSDHIEELQSAEVVERMNKRPLPPLPRSKKRQSKTASDSGSDRDSSSELPVSTEDEQTKRLKLGQLPTIISTDGSQEEQETVQTGRISFSLSDAALPVVEAVRTDSPSTLLRSVEMEDLTIPDAPISLSLGYRRLEHREQNGLPENVVEVMQVNDHVRISPVPAPIEICNVQPENAEVMQNDISLSSEPKSEILLGHHHLPSEQDQPVHVSVDYTADGASNQTIDIRPARSPVPAMVSVDPEKERHLNDLMNEVEKNLEVDVEKDIEDKIILLSSSSTQNLTYTPIEEVSISVQTDPSQEFEPLTDIIRTTLRDTATTVSEPVSQQANLSEAREAPVRNMEPIVQPVILNPEIRFPRSIPVEVPVIPPVQVQVPQRMRLSELEVDRLTVGHLTARAISTEELSGTSMLVNEVRSRDPLNVNVTVDPSTIQLRAPEIPPQQVVHVYERSESPAPLRPSRRKFSSHAPQEGCEAETEKSEEPLVQPEGVSQPPSSFSTLRSPDEPGVSREPTVRELATQLAAVSARELGSMAANAVSSVSYASQLVLRNVIEGMWTQVNSYLERHGILLDSKEQETSKVVMVCLLILVLIVIFFGMGGSRGNRWEFYLPPN